MKNIIFINYLIIFFSFSTVCHAQHYYDTIPPYRPYIMSDVVDTLFIEKGGYAIESNYNTEVISRDFFNLYQDDKISKFWNLLKSFQNFGLTLMFDYRIKNVDLCQYLKVGNNAGLDQWLDNQVFEFYLFYLYNNKGNGFSACHYSGIAFIKRKKVNLPREIFYKHLDFIRTVKALPPVLLVENEDYLLLIQPDSDSEKCTGAFNRF